MFGAKRGCPVCLQAGLSTLETAPHPALVARTPRVPRQLKAAPFTLAEARRHGLTLESLKSKAWKRLGSELYCWSGGQEDPWRLLAAWGRLVPPKAIFAGKTAAWILGPDFEPGQPCRDCRADGIHCSLPRRPECAAL